MTSSQEPPLTRREIRERERLIEQQQAATASQQPDAAGPAPRHGRSRSRTIGRCGLRRATSSKPAAANIDCEPNHIDSSADLPGLSTGYASRSVTPRRRAHEIAPRSSTWATPRPRCAAGTTKQTMDQTGASSTRFITGERSRRAYAARGPSDTQPTGVVPA